MCGIVERPDLHSGDDLVDIVDMKIAQSFSFWEIIVCSFQVPSMGEVMTVLNRLPTREDTGPCKITFYRLYPFNIARHP